ncbi:MAG TPA: hypothetical protein VFE24_05015, partial [Pirellulales bacterium]|nr:hypothetical protein [Pirellulales bacterium]
MSTGMFTPSNEAVRAAGAGESESFIDGQLRRTRAQVKAVDIAGGVMVLVIGSLLFWLAAALLDQWILPGGLGFWGRLMGCVGYLAAAGYFFAVRILPPLIKRINPLYAAQTIERAQPTLKNSVLNFLFFRSHREGVPDGVYQALRMQAAGGLKFAPIDTAVDRSRLIKMAYVLLGVLAACCAYKVLSPKDPFQTLGRVMLPWADLHPAARVQIDDIQPGDQVAYRGQQVKISALIRGLSGDENAVLTFSTADGQNVEQTLTMHVPKDAERHEVLLPGGDLGLQADAEYWIKAGDAVSRHYHLQAIPTPTITVDRIEFDYPDYMRFEHRQVENQGDIKEYEGTRVTLHAIANHPIKEAFVDWECDGTDDLRMRCEDRTATVSFELKMREGDRQTPEHTSYQLRFVTAAGNRNPEPVRYKIDVLPDLPPEVAILTPKADELSLPVNGRETFNLKAADPDFLLQSVRVIGRKNNEQVFSQELLPEAWKGQFLGNFEFVPQKYKLQAGDVIELFAQAIDNKNPNPNQTESATPHKKIQIVQADPRQQPNPQQPPNQGQNNQNPPQQNPPNGQKNQANNPQNNPQNQKPNQ